MQKVVKCPKCKSDIPIDEVLMQPIIEEERKKLQEHFDKQISEALKETEQRLKSLQEEIKEKERKLEEARKKEAELMKKQREIEEQKKSLELEVEKRVYEEKKKIEQELAARIEEEHRRKEEELKKQIERIRRSAEEEASKKLKLLEEELKEKDKKLEEAIKKELELRKMQRTLEEQKRVLELEVERRLDEERKKMEKSLKETLEYRYSLEKQEYEKRIMDMKRQIEELRMKAEQSSSQLRGEVLEKSLETVLRDIFREDEIVPVKTGSQGADIIHRVYTRYGHYCGTIIWEAKRTKNWQDRWLQKLREDQKKEGAEIAVLVSEVLPPDVRGLGIKERIIVTSYENIVPIAILLRNQLIEIAKIKSIHQNQEYKAKMIYEYLSSTKFRHKLETAIDVYNQMMEDLRKEKQTIQKLWAKREQQIEIAMKNISTLYGELQAIAGTSLAEIRGLNFPETDLDEQ